MSNKKLNIDDVKSADKNIFESICRYIDVKKMSENAAVEDIKDFLAILYFLTVINKDVYEKLIDYTIYS